MNSQQNPEQLFQAIILMILALEFESKAFMEIGTEKIQARLCLN